MDAKDAVREYVSKAIVQAVLGAQDGVRVVLAKKEDDYYRGPSSVTIRVSLDQKGSIAKCVEDGVVKMTFGVCI